MTKYSHQSIINLTSYLALQIATVNRNKQFQAAEYSRSGRSLP